MITGCLKLAVREVSLHHVNDMAGGQRGETITEQPSFSATKLRGSVPVGNFEEIIPGVLHRRQQVYVSR